MNILRNILLWFTEPWIANAGQELTNAAAGPMIGRVLVFYLPPVILARIYNRYTGRFSATNDEYIYVFWPIVVPLAAVFLSLTFIWDNGMITAIDWIVARLSRKIVAEDEMGRVYTQIQPRTNSMNRKDRIAAFVEVEDHTGKHQIRIDPDYLSEGNFSVHGAIALTFGKKSKDYHPKIET